MIDFIVLAALVALSDLKSDVLRELQFAQPGFVKQPL
jgi:hypothetical protein